MRQRMAKELGMSQRVTKDGQGVGEGAQHVMWALTLCIRCKQRVGREG